MNRVTLNHTMNHFISCKQEAASVRMYEGITFVLADTDNELFVST